MPLCIPKEYFGKTGFEDVFKIKDSLQREKKLGEFFDLKTAKDINNRFEKVKLLKKTEQGYDNMIKTIKGLDVEKRESFIAKLKAETERKAKLLEDMQTSGEVKTSEIMDIENLSKDIYNKKNGLEISDIDSKRLMEATNVAEEASKLPKDKYGNFDPIYAKAKYDLQKTIGEIKAKKPQVMKNGKLVSENKFFGKDSTMARETEGLSNREKLLYLLDQNRKYISSGTFKAMKATYDLSSLAIQGPRIFLTNPKVFFNTFKEAFKTLGGKKAWEAWNVMMLSKGRMAEGIEAGLRMGVEEQLVNNVVSNRFDNFFTASLQKARYDIYENSVNAMEKKFGRKLDITDANYDMLYKQAKDKAEELGKKFIKPIKDSQLLKEAASDANKMTGTTNLGKMEVLSPALNETFFAARYGLSDVKMYTDIVNLNMSKTGRVRAVKRLGQSMGAMMGTYFLLAQAFPDSTDTDPTSANFMRFAIGDKWYGIKMPGEWLFKLGAKMVLKREVNKNGKVTNLNEDNVYKGKTRGDVLLRTFRSKLAPIPSVLTDVAVGKDYMGRKATLGREALNLAGPITASGVVERAYETIFNGDDKELSEHFLNAMTDVMGITSYDQ